MQPSDETLTVGRLAVYDGAAPLMMSLNPIALRTRVAAP